MSTQPQRPLDETDVAILRILRRYPRSSHVELARRVGVSRGTAYSRIDRLEAEGVITGYGPEIDPERAGMGVLAFVTLEISQGSHSATIDVLARIPGILEVHTVTGAGDLLCRIVARSNDDLHEVLQALSLIHI